VGSNVSHRKGHSGAGTTRERGICIVEFAIVFPVLFLVLMLIIDAGRVITTNAILTRGASDGLNNALKAPDLDLDIRNRKPSDDRYLLFWEARSRVITQATRFPLSSWVTDPDTPSSIQLLPFRETDYEIDASDGTPILVRGAAVLRPGDHVEYQDRAGSWVPVDHETLPNPSRTVLPQSPSQLMRAHPVVVELRAKVKLLFPGAGETEVSSTAVGFREAIPQAGSIGPFVEAPPPGVSSTTSTTTSTTTTSTTTTTTTTTMMTCNPLVP
jgi:hypothetical protein